MKAARAFAADADQALNISSKNRAGTLPARPESHFRDVHDLWHISVTMGVVIFGIPKRRNCSYWLPMITKAPFPATVQGKVKKFVEGTSSSRDLDAIFLWLRQRSFGAKTVKDIGDFVAHADEKSQGIVWDKASLLSSMFRFSLPKLSDASNRRATEKDLEPYKESVLAVFDLAEPGYVKKSTGIAQKSAKRILMKALSKISIFNGRIDAHLLSDFERRLLEHFSTRLIINIAYDDARLAKELSECLIKNRLIDVGEIPKVLSRIHYIAAYAIEKMHLCTLIIEDKPPCILVAVVAPPKDGFVLSIACKIIVDFDVDAPVTVVSNIFETSCVARDCADATLWNEGDYGSWVVPIELGYDGRLTVGI